MCHPPLIRLFGCVVLLLWNLICSVNAAEPVAVVPVLLQMIRDEAIHEDLGLDESQRTKVLAELPEIDARWFRSRNLDSGSQSRELADLTDLMRERLLTILSAKQMGRVAQLERQALGTRMVLRDDVIAALQLKARQSESFIQLFQTTDQESQAIQKQVFDGKLDHKEGNDKLERLKDRERKQMLAILLNAQQMRLSELTGESFNFSRVRRTHPMAPELTSEGVSWIQGGPLQLSELRGKVVAVHFYAFQCINCQRNLPHYQAWHRDYADKGLVVIGIQTPETSAERSLDRVSAAAAKEGIEYPVMLDGESTNWSTWSNTMWPTVYLIDKQGFLRRWWQGEMNWNGTPGESQMRESLEALLDE